MVQTRRAVSFLISGIFLVALSTIMLEVLMTRIFSVTMGYHYAFIAISVAMFGMTVGAMQVHRHPEMYDRAHAQPQMARSALLCAILAVGSVLLHLLIPFRAGLVAFLWICLTWALLSLPFYFAGICICVALTKFPDRVSRFYTADLLGAASGCIVVIITLKIADAGTAVVLVGALGCVAASLIAASCGEHRLRRVGAMIAVALCALAAFNTVLAQRQESLLRLRSLHRGLRPLYEKWNTFSRITVHGNPNIASSVITEGISASYPRDRLHPQLHLLIDADAETTLTEFHGDLERLDFLKYDVKNVVHSIHPDSRVLVIGAGGGRDVLGALLLGQKSVLAVELNEDILRTVNGRFGAFTGHLDRNPKITFVNDEARSYIARTKEKFDVIEASYIDTWAATGAGGLSLTENSLYTVDAWKLFLSRLNPHGVLSFSRWYVPGLPAEAYRLTALAAAALRDSGIADPRAHILFVKNVRDDIRLPAGGATVAAGAVTILVCKEPFSAAEINHLEAMSKAMNFDIVLSPRVALDPVFSALAEGRNARTMELPLDVTAPTDDSPFFFYMKPLKNPMEMFSSDLKVSAYARGGATVAGLLIFVLLVTAYWVILPVWQTVRSGRVSGNTLPLFWFFGAIGLGFMLIELSQMQRLVVFLGHPAYALSVVLFALLLSSGIGSYTTARMISSKIAITRLGMLVMVLVLFGLATPATTRMFQGSITPVRIAVAIGILFPLGLFLGMAFPIGLKLAASQMDSIVPALWGTNGAASICGSVLAVAIAMNAGITAAFWSGVVCYVIALTAYSSAVRSKASKHAAAATSS